jgi:endogenous inhibitor of DNA gyrase (YacG/DUF329 family)
MPSSTCPICRKRFDPAESPAAPFCSVRCRQIDLRRWLSEDYTVSIPRHDADEDEAGEKATE